MGERRRQSRMFSTDLKYFRVAEEMEDLFAYLFESLDYAKWIQKGKNYLVYEGAETVKFIGKDRKIADFLNELYWEDDAIIEKYYSVIPVADKYGDKTVYNVHHYYDDKSGEMYMSITRAKGTKSIGARSETEYVLAPKNLASQKASTEWVVVEGSTSTTSVRL